MPMVLLVIAIVGALSTLAGAIWLLGMRPATYSNDGPLFPGLQISLAVPALMRAQRWPLALTVLGAAVQLGAASLALVIAAANPK